jgi:gas vesicle protein
MMRLINFLAGFIVGLALGGAVAMFMAPQSGSETQQFLQSRFGGILEEARQAAQAARTDAYTRLTELKQQ